MLILSRKNNKSVVVRGAGDLDDSVRVTVLGIDRGQVKLGFEAKKHISVHREEVWKRILAHRPTGTPATTHEESDRWADDGGGTSHEQVGNE